MTEAATINNKFYAKPTNICKTEPMTCLQDNTKIAFLYDLKPTIEDFKENCDSEPISLKMKNIIKNQETHEKYMTKEGNFIVYYGEADRNADIINNKQEPLLTVGYGHSQRGKIDIGSKELKEGDIITSLQAESLLLKDIQAVSDSLTNNTTCPLTKELKRNEKDAILSYGYNVGTEKIIKHDKTREIPESMIECINKGELGKAQAKFNIVTAGGITQAGLAKRRIIEMVIFGNGTIYKEAEETFNKNKQALSGIKKLKHVYDINNELKLYGIDNTKRNKIIRRLIFE